MVQNAIGHGLRASLPSEAAAPGGFAPQKGHPAP